VWALACCEWRAVAPEREVGLKSHRKRGTGGRGGEEEPDSGRPRGGRGLKEALEDKSTWACCRKFQNGIFFTSLLGLPKIFDTSWVVSVLCLFLSVPARMLGIFC